MMDLRNPYLISLVLGFVGVLICYIDSKISNTKLSRNYYLKIFILCSIVSLVSTTLVSSNGISEIGEELYHHKIQTEQPEF